MRKGGGQGYVTSMQTAEPEPILPDAVRQYISQREASFMESVIVAASRPFDANRMAAAEAKRARRREKMERRGRA